MRSIDHRVLRGGSFNNNARNARCAYRIRNDPGNINRNDGFRVVVSMFFAPFRNVLRVKAFSAEVKNSGAHSWPSLRLQTAQGEA